MEWTTKEVHVELTVIFRAHPLGWINKSIGWLSSKAFLKEKRCWEKMFRGEDRRGGSTALTSLKAKWPRTSCRNLHLHHRRWGWKRVPVVIWLTQPIRNSDSGSVLSLLGQNRCEKKEGAQEIEGRKKGVGIEYQLQIATRLSFLTGVIPLAQSVFSLSSLS